jgi:hypothetical protein
VSECVLVLLVLPGPADLAGPGALEVRKLGRRLRESVCVCESEGPNWTALQRVAALSTVVCSTARLVPQLPQVSLFHDLVVPELCLPLPDGGTRAAGGLQYGQYGTAIYSLSPYKLSASPIYCEHRDPPSQPGGGRSVWFEYLVSGPSGCIGWGLRHGTVHRRRGHFFAILVRIRDGKDVMIPISRLLSDVA